MRRCCSLYIILVLIVGMAPNNAHAEQKWRYYSPDFAKPLGSDRGDKSYSSKPECLSSNESGTGFCLEEFTGGNWDADPLPQSLQDNIWIPAFGASTPLGTGWNMEAGKPAGSCVEFKPYEPKGYESRNSEFHAIHTRADIYKFTDLDANIGLSYSKMGSPLAKAGSVSPQKNTSASMDARLKILRTSTFVSEYKSFYVKGSAYKQTTAQPKQDGFIQPNLKAGVAKLIKEGKYRSFIKACGDSFVGGRRQGAEVVGLWQIRTTDTTEKTELGRELNADYSNKGLVINAGVKSDKILRRTHKNGDEKAWLHVVGGSADSNVSWEAIRTGKGFDVGKIASAGFDLEVQLKWYEPIISETLGYEDVPSALQEELNKARTQRSEMTAATALYWEYQSVIELIDHITDNQSDYLWIVGIVSEIFIA